MAGLSTKPVSASPATPSRRYCARSDCGELQRTLQARPASRPAVARPCANAGFLARQAASCWIRRRLFVDATQQLPIAKQVARSHLADRQIAVPAKLLEREIGVKADVPRDAGQALLN